MKDRTKLGCSALFTALLLAGCGGGGGGGDSGQKPAGDHGSTPPAAQAPAPAAQAGGQTVTLTGTINLTGTAPERSPLKMNADAVCVKAHADAPALSQDVLVDANGMLQNVFVYVKNGLEGQSFDAPQEPVVFDQKGCMYTPHVFGIMVNQPFKILNSDPTLHNIHATPKKGEFNLGMPRQGMEFTKSFVEPEVMVHIKCDVHPWMSAYAGVLTHPYYGVSDGAGGYSIANLPAGEYTIEAWHEKFGAQTQTITVGATPTQELNFTFNAAGS